MNLAISPDWEVIRLYENQYPDVLRSAVRGDGLAREIVERSGIANRRSPSLRDFGLFPEDFQSVGSRLSPLLRAPSFFLKPISQAPMMLLWSWFSNHLSPSSRIREIAEEILSQSVFARGERRFRTQDSPRGPIIFGSSDWDILSLAGAAHELGHCLAERVLLPSGRLPVFSEAIAQVLEESVVSSFLQTELELSEWLNFRGRVHRLNIYFEAFESGEISPSNYTEDYCFDPSLLVLRETLFTAPGYQSVYAEASRLMKRLDAKGAELFYVR